MNGTPNGTPNGTANGTHVLRDPYVQGAHDPWAAAPGDVMNGNGNQMTNQMQSQGQNQGQAQGQGGMPPAAQPTQEQTGNQLDMQHGLSADVIGSPISVEEAYLGSMRGMLGRQIGAYIAATFLMGNGELVRWEGRLFEVGNNYLIIYQQVQGRYIVGDLNSLRFVEFSESGDSVATMLRACNNGPTSW